MNLKVIFAALILVSCAGQPAYREATHFDKEGYTDGISSAGTHYVTYRASKNLDDFEAYRIAFMRAAEITEANHGDWFEILGVHVEEKTISMAPTALENFSGGGGGNGTGLKGSIKRSGDPIEIATLVVLEFHVGEGDADQSNPNRLVILPDFVMRDIETTFSQAFGADWREKNL